MQTIIPWLTFSDGPEIGEVTDAPGDSVAGLSVWEDPQCFDVPPDDESASGAGDAAAQVEIEHAHEHEVEEERHNERMSYMEFSRVVGWCDRGILSEEAYKFLMSFDKGAAQRQRAREKEWASGKLALKERAERRDAMIEARRACRRMQVRVLSLVEKMLRRESEAKIRRLERWQKSRRKVQLWHDRFDSRIAGYSPDQKERLERYRDSLDKQSRFAFTTEKQKEAEEKIAELSRFQVANQQPSDSGRNTPIRKA